MKARQTVVGAGSIMVFALLMGMGPPGCAGSQDPLSEREQGHTDYYLIGRWHDLEFGDDGEYVAGPLRLEVSLLDDGGLRIELHEDEDDFDSGYGQFTGHTTRLSARKYLNLRLDMSKWDDEDREEFAQMPCPYFIVQYSTFLPRSIAASKAEIMVHILEFDRWNQILENDGAPAPDWTESAEKELDLTKKLLRQGERDSGKLLFYSEMDIEFVEDAITDRVIDGMADCDNCLGACMEVDEAELRAFVQENDEQLFDYWEWLIREPK